MIWKQTQICGKRSLLTRKCCEYKQLSQVQHKKCYTRTRVYVCTSVCMRTCVHAYVCICVGVYMCMYVCVCVWGGGGGEIG